MAGPGDDEDDLLDELFGVTWLDGPSWGFARRPAPYPPPRAVPAAPRRTRRPAPYPPRRRPPSEPALLAARYEQEKALHRRRVAALKAEIAQLRREAGKAGRDAARWREKAEAWRREAVRLARARDRTVVRRAVRRVRALAFPQDR
ncbi:hypothetical protein [Nonomuraea pusilla]|uniref:hypothetical protein n=1 Tax=Nonomuraea pusilla TaxID=46177 RepID=UPI0033305C71